LHGAIVHARHDDALPMGSPSARKRIAPVTPWNAMFSDKFARYSRILARSDPTCSTAWASSFVAS
jgi:hypothetical protein